MVYRVVTFYLQIRRSQEQFNNIHGVPSIKEFSSVGRKSQSVGSFCSSNSSIVFFVFPWYSISSSCRSYVFVSSSSSDRSSSSNVSRSTLSDSRSRRNLSSLSQWQRPSCWLTLWTTRRQHRPNQRHSISIFRDHANVSSYYWSEEVCLGYTHNYDSNNLYRYENVQKNIFPIWLQASTKYNIISLFCVFDVISYMIIQMCCSIKYASHTSVSLSVRLSRTCS